MNIRVIRVNLIELLESNWFLARSFTFHLYYLTCSARGHSGLCIRHRGDTRAELVRAPHGHPRPGAQRRQRVLGRHRTANPLTRALSVLSSTAGLILREQDEGRLLSE